MSEYLTVVFEIKDREKFNSFKKVFLTSLATESSAYKVTAMSIDDEITRLDLIQEALDAEDGLVFSSEELIRDLLKTHNIHRFKSLQEWLASEEAK